jgi:hypothetical protein
MESEDIDMRAAIPKDPSIPSKRSSARSDVTVAEVHDARDTTASRKKHRSKHGYENFVRVDPKRGESVRLSGEGLSWVVVAGAPGTRKRPIKGRHTRPGLADRR